MNDHRVVTSKNGAYEHSLTFSVHLADGGDSRALGGAVTRELCGDWFHDGPCVYPHYTSVERVGDVLKVAVSFNAPSSEADTVRRRIMDAVKVGGLVGPDGHESHWELLS